MAIKWAVADGNWTATATWNDGTIPQVGDVVYCNGHVITLTGDVNLGTGEIRNDPNDAEGILGGGYLSRAGGATITANFIARNSFILRSTNNTGTTSFTLNGNIDADCPFFATDGSVYNTNFIINGNIECSGIISEFLSTRSAGNNYSITINGNVTTTGTLVLTVKHYTISINGNVSGDVTLLGGQGTINTLSIVGELTQGTLKLATAINTFNLNGTLNLSGTKPFDYGVQTLNVASGSSITYDNHFYYCYNEINAIDADFDIVCRNQNLDNLQFINNNNLADTYPDEDKVVNGVEYGYSGEYEGSMELIDESVVLAGYHYGNKTGTFSVQMPSALTTKLTEVLNKINDAYTRLGNMQTLQNTINDAIAELPSEQFIVETIGG